MKIHSRSSQYSVYWIVDQELSEEHHINKGVFLSVNVAVNVANLADCFAPEFFCANACHVYRLCEWHWIDDVACDFHWLRLFGNCETAARHRIESMIERRYNR